MGNGFGMLMLLIGGFVLVCIGWGAGALLYLALRNRLESTSPWRIAIPLLIFFGSPAFFSGLGLLQISLSERDETESAALSDAAKAGDVATLKELLEDGYTTGCTVSDRCALEVAIGVENWTMVRLLIEHGAKNHSYAKGGDAATRLKRRRQTDLATGLLANGDEGELHTLDDE